MNVHRIFGGCSLEEAWPLIKEFHYSKRMPANIQHIYCMRRPGGLFGDTGEVVAVCVFSIPPTRWNEEVLELSRLVRRDDEDIQLSRLISSACKWLKKNNRDLVISFADWTQRHHGGIYRASSWAFAGKNKAALDGVLVNGTFIPGRSCNSKWGTRSPKKLRKILPHCEIEPSYDEGKFLYWKALGPKGRAKAARLGLRSLPYDAHKTARSDFR